jgi:D-alanyl-D-alanine carboxypeptidase/D-alanyl-D-alanine-endopeptidase (penicillin-binding protein 4)
VGLLAVAAITLAGFGSFSHTSSQDARVSPAVLADRGATNPTTSTTSTAPIPTVGTGATGTLTPMVEKAAPRTAAEQRLQASLSKMMNLGGPASGALVYDLDTHAKLYARRPDIGRPPASVEKIYTTVALMRIMGPQARLHTTVLGTGHLGHGVWHGNLYLRGGGDPTFGDAGFNRIWEQGYGPTASQLVAQLVRLGIKRVTGQVYADESLFDTRRGGLMTNYAVDIPDFGGQISALTFDHGADLHRLPPAIFALRQFVATMRGALIAAKAARHTAETPVDARQLAVVSSPPMSAMARLMDVPSDDLFAEMFTKQLGVLFGSGGSISAGAQVIGDTMASLYGVHPRILDGSGLSRNDRSSPQEMVDLLRQVWHTPVGNNLAASLPVVGKQGTVQTIGLKSAAVGRCIAKTGSLTDVTNLAGYCNSKGGHRLAFALFMDGPPNWTAFALESKMVGAIARY